ncbi:uncharacterized protein LOC34620492 [Cyclospora cayetanensis]|uniref:Uncharacterized protein LOC34620492 n=1 Tax=Cyclospora cayetanensis TaxID=88456 RepID=A0A6P6RYI3_9EIME|nr:uncharacterized protein LOC34620492 [Cyclospora cayetanensis]
MRTGRSAQSFKAPAFCMQRALRAAAGGPLEGPSPALAIRKKYRWWLRDLLAAFPLDPKQQEYQEQQLLLLQNKNDDSVLWDPFAADEEQPAQSGGSSVKRRKKLGSPEDAGGTAAAMGVYEELRSCCLDFLCVLLHLSCCHTEHRRCCVVRCRDVAVARDALGSEQESESSSASSSDESWHPASPARSSGDSEGSTSGEDSDGASEAEGPLPNVQVCVTDSGECDSFGGVRGVFQGASSKGGGGPRLSLQEYLSSVVNCRCGCAEPECDPDEDTESEAGGEALEDTTSSSEEEQYSSAGLCALRDLGVHTSSQLKSSLAAFAACRKHFPARYTLLEFNHDEHTRTTCLGEAQLIQCRAVLRRGSRPVEENLCPDFLWGREIPESEGEEFAIEAALARGPSESPLCRHASTPRQAATREKRGRSASSCVWRLE